MKLKSALEVIRRKPCELVLPIKAVTVGPVPRLPPDFDRTDIYRLVDETLKPAVT